MQPTPPDLIVVLDRGAFDIKALELVGYFASLWTTPGIAVRDRESMQFFAPITGVLVTELRLAECEAGSRC